MSGQTEQLAVGVTRIGGRRHAGRVLALAALAALLASALQAVALPVPGASAVTVGSGSYADSTPAGGAVPQDCAGGVMDPRSRTTANFPAGAVPTNDWWTSLLWNKINCTDESANLMAHPLAFHSFTDGLGVSYPTNASISGTSTGVSEYHYSYAEDVRIGIAGLTAPGKVDTYSDWTVTEQWSNGGSSLRATIGHGLPFVYATKTGGDVRLTLTSSPNVWRNAGGAIGFTVNGHDYAAFGPNGSSWSVSGTTISSSLAGGAYFSLAVLPTSSNNTARAAALDAYAPYAHNHVTGTRVSWAYNEATAKLTATYAFTTVAKQGGGANGTVFALYPHQRDALSGVTPSAYSYVSPRGPMRVVIGASQFQTVSTFNGVLPQLANTGFASGSADLSQLSGYVDQVANVDPFAGFGEDTYWTGKALGRATQVIQIANLTGKTSARDSLVGAVRTRLTDWMTASPGETQRLFAYNQNWGTLIGYPASYGSDTELNDHHFHYGYYVVAAATVAQFDPSWAANSAYGGMVNTVIKDAANWDRGDTRFPFLRDFDIYAGHDWAAGHGSFGAGNNQESSSEGMNFASGLIMWGQATGNTAVRDLGIYLYTTQASAIQNYWFDTDDEAFPAAFGHSTVGMVWGDGGAYSTWFSAEPEMIQGINLLPSTAGHLYLGYDPAYIGRNLAELQTNNGGPATVWQDIIWEFQALADAPTALSQFRSQAGSYAVEEGESRAHTFYWVKNLSTIGTVDRTVTADTPLYAVFTKNGVRNHQAANMSGSAITVHFSDGVNLSVPARSVASSSGGSTGGGDTSAPSTPTGLTASGTTASTTNLSWSASSDNVGVTGYDILLGGSSIGTVGGTAATVTGLAASTSYTFAVRAKDAAGNLSGASSSVTVTTSSTGGDGGDGGDGDGGDGGSGDVDATSRIQAESYSAMSGVQVEATSDQGGGDNVGWIGNGDYLRYDGVDFGSTTRTQFTARVASGAAAGISGLVSVRLDSRTAAPIGSFALANTGGWQNWQSIPANIQGTTGVHTVYLTFESGQPADFVNVNWFTFG